MRSAWRISSEWTSGQWSTIDGLTSHSYEEGSALQEQHANYTLNCYNVVNFITYIKNNTSLANDKISDKINDQMW